MTYALRLTVFLAAASILFASCGSSSKPTTPMDSPGQVVDVNPALFLKTGVSVSTVACTLSDGSSASCLKIVSNGAPADHQMGPWCPTNISDGADKGGIWVEGGEVFDVDGEFVKNMATFYDDDNWKMYDAEGNISVTKTQEECAAAARPDVDPKYQNFCVECLPSYVTDIKETFLLPIHPVRQTTSSEFARGPRGGVSVRGVAFNGVRFDANAPTDHILSAYTLAPFDDAGGHINLHAGYHYHAATGVSTEIAQPDGHAPMIGYAMDGFGLYALLNEHGEGPGELDECRGQYDEVRGYHYHVDAAGANNFINCLNGAYAKGE